MASRAKTVADAMTTAMNVDLTLPQEMPLRTPFAKTAVAPNILRETDPGFGAYNVIGNRIEAPGTLSDRCGTIWASSIQVILVRRFDQYDEDLEQPATLLEIDKCIENAEYISEWLDSYQFSTGRKMNIDVTTLVDDEWLRSQSMFLAQITMVIK